MTPNRLYKVICPFLFIFLLLFSNAIGDGIITKSELYSLQNKKDITIAVTDSGLGGLSVVADVVVKLQESRIFRSVNLVFYNALFTNQGGYNSLQSRDEKLRIFSAALQGLEDRYAPDLILVACNTLSVIYQDTDFAAHTKIPVMGIVQNGVDQIFTALSNDQQSRNIIFATETTIDEGAHKDALILKGVKANRIVTQACPELTLYIEQGFDSMETEMLIDAYVDEAVSKIGKIDSPLFISFNCTHFGYALQAWQEAFKSRGIKVERYLNPNNNMIDFLIPRRIWNRYSKTQIGIDVVSQIKISKDRQASIGRYIQTISPETSEALRKYQFLPNLFRWKHLLTKKPNSSDLSSAQKEKGSSGGFQEVL